MKEEGGKEGKKEKGRGENKQKGKITYYIPSRKRKGILY